MLKWFSIEGIMTEVKEFAGQIQMIWQRSLQKHYYSVFYLRHSL